MSPALTIIFFMAMSLQGQGPATWSSTESYTYPSLVIDNGVTYISKQNVPAGTLLTNDTYWATLDSQVPDETPTGQDELSTPDVSTKPNDIPEGTGSSTSSENPGIVRVNVRGTVSKGQGARIVSFKLAFDNGSTTDTSDVLVRGIGPGLSGDADGNYRDVGANLVSVA